MTVGSWRVRTRLAVRLAAGATVAAAGVAGCSAQTGAAAVVDGHAIPIADVHEATEQLGPYLQDPSPSAVLLLLVAAPTFERVAAEHGIGVSPQETQGVLDGLVAPADGEEPAAGAPVFGPASRQVARFTLVQRKLQADPNGAALLQEAGADLADLDVDVNPRYGEVDFTDGSGITPVAHDWLVPAATTP